LLSVASASPSTWQAIAEDDAASAKLAALLLTKRGAHVRVTRNAEEALNVLEEFRPRCVALDLVLPRMGGLVLAQHIKTDARLRDTVIVATSVIGGRDVERVAREAGCAAHLLKPINTETFAATWADCLE
jgi:CheY-like chemotaxis protein